MKISSAPPKSFYAPKPVELVLCVLILSLLPPTSSYVLPFSISQFFKGSKLYSSRFDVPETPPSQDLASDSTCSKITLQVCSSTKCSRRRKQLQIDEYSLLSGLMDRVGSNPINVEDSGCLGWCKRAPCVKVEHSDYDGSIGLEGMDDMELAQRCFFNILTEDDADRIWSSVAHGVRQLELEDNE
ncbi:hypothetical protein TrLO_g9624 [Triparma laevis f. longispina]|uniref:Uncharacterized protein n=1 Tax=Triparma laevis f. longispina TaxID=1714387 RepID=A0A9W7FQE4_9STRA|nr:hypothetical protein TrLO_g9624 [Triparma laevis f. longispina]